jgi:hypothetical protein
VWFRGGSIQDLSREKRRDETTHSGEDWVNMSLYHIAFLGFCLVCVTPGNPASSIREQESMKSGIPSRILDACFLGYCEMAVSPEIFEEYLRVGSQFSKRHPNTDLQHLLALILNISILVEDTKGAGQICSDPDDDKFIHCAIEIAFWLGTASRPGVENRDTSGIVFGEDFGGLD